MIETTTSPEREGATFPITIEDDATPLVRLIGRTLRDAARSGHAQEVLGRSGGTVAVRSHDTPQAASITLDRGGVTVTGGVFAEADATIVVDLLARFAPVQEPTGEAALGAATLNALRPPLPPWRDSAERFWALNRDIPGVPDVLLVEARGLDGVERGRFGDGPTEYLMAGSSDLLAGVFTGADDLLASLAAGLQVKGTLAQLSVMTAASWKVRFDV